MNHKLMSYESIIRYYEEAYVLMLVQAAHEENNFMSDREIWYRNFLREAKSNLVKVINLRIEKIENKYCLL